jgi:hypothetical protein
MDARAELETLMKELVAPDALAQIFDLEPSTVRSARWQVRARLYPVKLGGKVLGFRRDDVKRALRRAKRTMSTTNGFSA